jgi:hypothetical protein
MILSALTTGLAPAVLLAATSQPTDPQHWHAFIDAWFMAIPMSIARLAPVALLVTAGIGTLFVKRSFVYLGAPDQAWWRDLRLWSIFCLIPYVVIYVWFS